MKKFVRFAGVALLALTITIGVASCGDDDPVAPVAPVAPPAPPPPPLVVTMSPASQMIGVGGTVVFAVSVSGGVAGEAASWICDSSDLSKATVSDTPVGCAATAVAAGGVTITAAVTKGGETVNRAAGLTITEDMAERAFVFIASIKDSDTDTDQDDEVLSRRVSVTLSVELGDQMLTQLSVLVDGLVAGILSSGGASVVAAAPEGEEGERAAQQAVHPFVLSFNSAEYDTLTGEPTYMNGERTITAELMVASSDEPIKSLSHAREFGNGDGVHVSTVAPSNSDLDSQGTVWFGGPGTTLEINARPVLYSGGSASAVTLLGFCGANAETVNEAPFDFAPDCEGKGKTAPDASPEFTLTVGEEAIAVGAEDIKNKDDDIFPINLDYEGPGAPIFKPNPNGREDGWVNASVAFTSTSSRDKNAWLTKTSEGGGVGGYTTQLRFATVPSGDMDKGLTEALEATAYQAVPPGAVEDSKVNAYCVVASALDDLGNESGLPDDEDGICVVAGSATQYDDMDTPMVLAEAAGYTALVEALAAAKKAEDDDDIEDAEDALADAGLLAGVDLTPPVAVFTGSGLVDEDDTSLGANPTSPTENRYVLHLTDNRGLRAGEAVVDTLEIRHANGDRDGLMTTLDMSLGELAEDQPLVTVQFAASEDGGGVGYYTYTAQAQDMAGNLSEAISRVAVYDITIPVAALIFARGDDAFEYDKTLVAADNLSVRDYSVVVNAANLPGATPVRLNHEMVSAYDGALEQSKTVNVTVEIPFIAVVDTDGDDGTVASGDAITSFATFITDHADNVVASDLATVTVSVEQNGDLEIGDGIIDGTYGLTVESDDGKIDGTDNTVGRSEDTITLTATADVPIGTVINPFAGGVYFFVQVRVTYDGMGADRNELRMIGMVEGINAEPDTDESREWTYETEISADDYYAIVGGATPSTGEGNMGNMIHALGVNGDGVALPIAFGTLVKISRR